MLKLTNAGEKAALAAFVGKTPAGDLALHLYTNNLVLSDNLAEADMIEPTFGGYSATLMTGAVWNVLAGDPATAEYVEQLFICTVSPSSPQTIYGYYVTGGGEIMWAEKFPIPQIIKMAGERIGIAPRLTARDESD